MIILKPKVTRYLPHKDMTQCFFDGDLSQEFFIRGAIAWPEGDREGFAILAGQSPRAKVVIIFEEFPFWTVDVYQEGGKFKQLGLETFLLETWSKYHNNVFYAHQHPEVHRRYSLQVYEAPGIAPKPELVDVSMVERLEDNLWREYVAQGKLWTDQRMKVNQELLKHFTSPTKNPPMAVHAMRCLLAGYEYAGWMEPGEQVREVVFHVS